MTISKYTHNLKSADGNPVFIARTPNREFTGKRFGVTFIDGEATFTAKTNEIPKRLDEEFGYEIILPAGYRRWKYAVKQSAARAVDPATQIGSAGAIQTAPETFGEDNPIAPLDEVDEEDEEEGTGSDE